MDASDFVPNTTRLDRLATAARRCEGCELYRDASQTVFGQGPTSARLVLVGEQPGDIEDRRGEPFVGPAGKVLDEALADAGISRDDVYVTNAVKHFRWKSTASGKRRLHQKPDARHVTACQPWLTAELTAIRPDALMALGATAAQALFGSKFRLTQHRGEVLAWPPSAGPYARSELPIDAAFATIHPSAVLRGREDRKELFAGLVTDLELFASRRGRRG
jgi:DNA polymerase